MNLFYFNHFVPENKNKELVSSAFSATYKEYNELRKKFPDDVDGIVTAGDAHQIFLIPEQFSLAQCISSMERSMRFAAYGAFTKYPFNNHFTEVNEEEMILNQYKLTVAGVDKDAHYLKVVADNSGFSFSLGVSDDLKVHPLLINGDDGSVMEWFESRPFR
jgi:hypothetical protein